MLSRRSLLGSVGVALAGLFGGRAVAERTRDATFDWPMARYDPAGTGYNPDASGPKDGAQLRWEHDTDGSFRAMSTPILFEDTLYAVSGGILALDAETGEERFSRDGSYQSAPAAASSSIYRTDALAVSSPAGIYGVNAGGGIRTFNLGFGTERWHGPGREPGFDFFGPPDAPSPVAVDDTVYAVIPGTKYVVALDADNGRERWRTSPVPDGHWYTLHRPAFRDGTLFIGNAAHLVTAHEAETGKEYWTTDLEQTVLEPTATAEGVVVPTRSTVALLEADTGDVRWERDHEGNATEGAAAIADGTVFVADGGSDRLVRALDLETGQERWAEPLARSISPVVADGVVYASGPGGIELVALDAETGERRWEYETEWRVSQPIVGDGVVYAADHDRILALEEDR